MAKFNEILTENRMVIWFREANTKQKITVIVGGVLMIAGLSFAIYQAVKTDGFTQSPKAQTQNEVNVQGIDTTSQPNTTNSSTLDLSSSPVTENTATITPTQNQQPGEANAATITVSADEGYTEYGDDGAIYEGGNVDVVETEPAYEPAPSNAGWDGNLNIPDGDKTGSDGNAIFIGN